MTEKFLTLQEIEADFDFDDTKINAAGIQIDLLDDLWITGSLWGKKPVEFELVVIIKQEDPHFSEKLGISSIKELEEITMEYLWTQYQKGNGQVFALMYELFDMEIVFQQRNGKTYVSRHDRDQTLIAVLEETSTDVNWFRAYIRDNARRWYEMAEEKDELGPCSYDME